HVGATPAAAAGGRASVLLDGLIRARGVLAGPTAGPLPIERVARPIAAVAVVGHALGARAPIRILPLVETAARVDAAVAVVDHALRIRLLRGGDARGDAESRHGQHGRKA